MSADELAMRARRRIDWMVSYMAMTERFYFEVLARMVRKATYAIETMAVGPCGIQVQLYYNPAFVGTLDDSELRWVLVHELAHVVLHHIGKRQPTDPSERVLHNMAADLAVNSLFGESPGFSHPRIPGGRDGETWILLPSQFGYPERLSMEQYRDMLRQDQRDARILIPDAYADGHAFDLHQDWQESPVLAAQIREWIGGIRDSQSWGNLGGDAVAAVLAAQQHFIPWTRLLRCHYGRFAGFKLRSTFKRPSRRGDYPWCGQTRQAVDKTLVAIDTSASIQEADLSSFLAETNGLAESHPVDLVTWDVDVHMGKPIPWTSRRPRFCFTGRGGTNVQPVLDMASRLRYRQVVVLTDGDFAVPDLPNGISILWVLLPGQSDRACLGGPVIRMGGRLS